MEQTFTTRWFYVNIEKKTVAPGRYACAVCGLPMAEGVDVKNVLRPTFTDYQALRKPESKLACAACAWYFDNQTLRSTGWILSATSARQMTKHDWLPALKAAIENGSGEHAYYLIRPGGMAGKHLALYAPLVSAGSRNIRARWSVNTVNLDNAWLDLVSAAHKLRERHSWAEIESDNYIAKFTAEWPSVSEFEQLRNTVARWLNTPYLDLAIFVWQKEKGDQIEAEN